MSEFLTGFSYGLGVVLFFGLIMGLIRSVRTIGGDDID